MRLAVTDEEYFQTLKDKTKTLDLNKVDRRVSDIISMLNRELGIATAFSCESHPIGNKSSRFYITMGVTSKGLDRLFEIADKLFEELKSRKPEYEFLFELQFAKLYKQTSPFTQETWNSWTISALLNKEEKDEFIHAFQTVLVK